ncbi:MAG: hypothetical protein HOV68_16680 [Streptomycetaceae bacterium]|nr:hypothetical protein [Streptomycetaceae bacterium]
MVAVIGVLLYPANSSGGLPDRACWGSIDAAVLENAAPQQGDWHVKESTDQWGDPTCTLRKGSWEADVTVMKTPLRSHLWWQLGSASLGGDLPGMVKPGAHRTDGWLDLPQCGDRLVNANVPAADVNDAASADLTARLLLAVGNTRASGCGGAPFPVPAAFDWDATARPHQIVTDPCGITGLPAAGNGGAGGLVQVGRLDPHAAVSRCSVLREDESAGDAVAGPGLFAVTVVRDRATLDALSPTGIRTSVTVTPGASPAFTDEDLRYDRDGVTELSCGPERRYVHVITTGSDADYTASKRAALNAIAAGMNCG